jgi:hypothetical protein
MQGRRGVFLPSLRAVLLPESLIKLFSEGSGMSLLRKIISTIRSDHAQQAIEEFPPAMPTANCLTAEVALVDRSVGELEEDDNPTKQRRYYVKRGLYVDHEEEVLASRSATAQEVIFDKTPTDLKSLFPKLSLR